MFTKTYQHLQGKEASIGVCLVFLLNFQSAPDYRNVKIISDQQQHVQYSHTHKMKFNLLFLQTTSIVLFTGSDQ